MKIEKLFGHIKTITTHKWIVLLYCFRVGLYRQGILHDLSKFSLEEFITGVVYYQGSRSPNAAEREAYGFSKAWLHHKGRNKHHYEYWMDYTNNPKEGLVGHKMPLNYVIEMFIDRIAACKTYKRSAYTDKSPLEYYELTKNFMIINSETRKMLKQLLDMLKEQGEDETFNYIKKLLKKGNY